MTNNLTVTGNKAQFNEDVVFLKNFDLRGNLTFGSDTSLFTKPIHSFELTKLDINGDLETENLLIKNDLDVLGNSDFVGITTARTEFSIGIAKKRDCLLCTLNLLIP